MPGPLPPSSSSPSRTREWFPDTQPKLIRRWLKDGEIRALNYHIMSVYYGPLQAYVRGSSARRLGDPAELVSEFFADRLEKDEYLAGWEPSRIRLRRYLINGLWFYLRKRARKDGREAARRKEMPGTLPEMGDGPLEAFHRAHVRELVHKAMKRTRRACGERLSTHYRVFFLRKHEGHSYAEIEKLLDLDPRQAAVMARTVTRRFKEALGELVRRELGLDPRSGFATVRRELAELASASP